MVSDLREFIDKVDEIGELKRVDGADWDLEIGVLTEIEAATKSQSMLLFDNIKGHKPGYRVVSNLFNTNKRIALAYELPERESSIDLVQVMREKLKTGTIPIPPVEVATGPVMENVVTGDDVDLLRFPSPKWHELDGGRFIGTGSAVIVKDPDTGYVNVSCQRIQVHDEKTAGIYFAPARHSMIVAKKYWSKDLPMPVAVSCGQEPLLWAASCWLLPWGASEYDLAGGLKGKPVETVRGVTTDLPLPATAEIVLEGEIPPPEEEKRLEGPFGECLGYYAGGETPKPVIRVKSILHRNDPIIQGNPPAILSSVWDLGRHIQISASLWDDLDRQVPGVKGVWVPEETGMRSMVVVSLKQEYAGHAKRAAAVVAGNSFMVHLRYIVIVDEDIDPSNMDEVLWALGTRSDPDSIDVLRGTMTAPPNPAVPPEKRSRGDFTHSTAIILACRPYHWINEFPASVKSSPELVKKVRDKWAKLFP
ncbi:UbiD family decarboxylase [Chloroflexota bacterium]